VGRGRDRIVTDPKRIEPDDDLLEFLGGIDEVNDESKDGDFSDFLAKTDIDKLEMPPPKRKPSPKAPEKDEKSE
jgi:hypothetical protein